MDFFTVFLKKANCCVFVLHFPYFLYGFHRKKVVKTVVKLLIICYNIMKYCLKGATESGRAKQKRNKPLFFS